MSERFDSSFRKNLIMALCADPDFFRKAVDFLRPEMIIERPIQFAYSVLLRCYEREGKLPSPEVLQMAAIDDYKNDDIPYELRPSENELDEYLNTISMASVGLKLKSTSNTAYMSSKLKDFLQMCYMAAIPSEATSSQKLEMYSKIYGQMQTYDTSETTNALSLDEALSKMSETVDIRNRVGTGLSTLDVPLNGGLAPGEIGLIVAPSGTGKAIPNRVVIPTPDGMRQVGDIREGEMLFGADGSPTMVTHVFRQPCKKEVYRVFFEDGRKADCCKEHLWAVYVIEGSVGYAGVFTTEELLSKMTDSPDIEFSVQSCGPVEFPENPLPEDPYKVGAALAEGRPVRMIKTYMTASERQRRAILDGFVYHRNMKCDDSEPSATETATETDNAIPPAVLELCYSLGVKLQKDGNRLTVKDAGLIRIVKIRRTGRFDDMTCFKVAASDHLWLTNDYIVTHNSNAMLNFACENALRGNESLYITLELSMPTVLARIVAMLTGIKASLISKGTSAKAMESWTESERKRFSDLVSRDGKHRRILESLKILEYTDRHVTPDTIKQDILKWKEARIKSGISEDKLGFVAVDWLNNIDPSTLSVVNKNQNQAYVMEKVTEALRQVGSATGTRVWTAQQAARGALNKEVLTMQDGRDSSGTFNPVDIALGLAIKKDIGEKGSPSVRILDSSDKVKMDPDRDMIWSIMKDRNSGATGVCIKFYQGPSLKFFESKKECQRAELINRNMK